MARYEMKRYLHLLIVTLIGFALLQSCVIEKRKYMRGWHVSSKKINRGESNNQLKSAENLELTKQVANTKEIDQVKLETIIPEVVIPEEEKIFKKLPEVKTNDVDENHQVDYRNHRAFPRQSELYVTTIKSKLNDIESRVSEQNDSWILKILGGFLGALLALIALPILFLVLFFFFDWEEDSVMQFSESRKDTAFARSFKKSFNAVFKIGVLILTIALVIVGLVFLLIFLYNEIGIWGVLAVIGLFLLLIWGLSLLFEGIMDFLLPDY